MLYTHAPRLAVLVLIFALILAIPAGASADGTATPIPDPNTLVHVVQSGDTLFQIAQQYGTTVDAIAQANGIKDVTALKIGQHLVIPDVNAAAANTAVDAGYIVQPGDSLTDLSWRYGIAVSTLAEKNHIVNPTQFYAGLNLVLPAAQAGSNPIKTGWIATVRHDDNLYRLAARYHVSLALLMKANQLKRPSVLIPGQQVVIPGNVASPALADLPDPFTHIEADPLPAQQGRTVILHLSVATSVKLSGTFMQKPITAFTEDNGKTYVILIGIDAFATPGLYPLNLTAVDGANHQTTFAQNIAVADGNYNSESIILPPDQLDLLDPKVTQPELDHVMGIVSRYSPKRYFNGIMTIPASAAITSSFGTRRSYNGGPFNQWHTGSDFGAAPGSPIYAPAAGVVVMVASLHVRGNATIIDHGWGVYTGYWHQSEIKVKVGQIVQRGDLIGLVGGTGRATGPHLHWEMFVGGKQVDPLQWIRQAFP